MFIGFIILIGIYCTDKHKYKHKHKYKDKHKDRHKNIIPTENYVNKTQKLLGDLNFSNQSLIDLANNYVENRQGYEKDVSKYKTDALALLDSVSNNEKSASYILTNILDSSIMVNFSHDLSIMSIAVINAQNDADIATKALEMIKKLVNDNSVSDLQLNEFGDALSSIQNQQDIANKSYLNVQNHLNNISSIYKFFNQGLNDILKNLNSAQDDFNKLNDFMTNITGNIKKTQDYSKLEITVNKSLILLQELKSLKVDEANQYYSVIENLITKLENSIKISQSFLTNIISIFTYATHDYSSKLYGELNELEVIYNKILSLIGITSDSSIIYPETEDLSIYPVSQEPIPSIQPITEEPVFYSNEGFTLNYNSTSNILDYYKKLLQINSTITNQYNQIITSYNIVSEVINSIQELTSEIIKNMDSNVNNLIDTDELNKLQDILLQYFPASTRPPITIPPLDKLVDYDYTPIPNMTTIPPYNPNPINPPDIDYPVTEYPITEYPVTEYPVTDYPVTDYPVTDYPVTDYPVTDYSVTDYPVTDYPVTDYPVTDYPVTDYPVTDYPVTDYPVTDYPVTDYPVTDYPVTDYPVTDYPIY